MDPEIHRRRYVRQPKPESKIQHITAMFYAYDRDGTYKERVLLTPERKRDYEARGFTFKRCNGVMHPSWREREDDATG
ncbi:hypothetical protein [Streptomyces hydrogenans]|uniref:Uncharacterized protein n=1 Tax=Streptomyces hydrogenans TaxID=1873719 RepID=A0ABQ3PJI9_9ACTN|nr:hypothetical protein [Streptomyces hydrogenans]GHG10267.1 hypothetical protein GCM10018784_23740 [Streptomyces hydrogenans]GHI25174.1 hypothetical protein Shyd_65450 [Streptomyces hydrogenans]